MASDYYGVAYSRYWTGDTGRAIRDRGGPVAQLLGVYLLFNANMNMLGLYPLKLRDVADDLGQPEEALRAAFSVLAEVGYASYDEASRFVWVREMCRFRLQLEAGRPLARDDKRATGAQRLYARLDSNPFLGPFYDRYAGALHLQARRTGGPAPHEVRPPDGHLSTTSQTSTASTTISDATRAIGFMAPAAAAAIPTEARMPSGRGFEGPLEGLRRALQGAPKGLQRGLEASDQKQGSEIRDQVQRTVTSSALRAPHVLEGAEAARNVGVITKIAHEAIDVVGAQSSDLSEAVKGLCAQRRIAYDSATVRKAIESALVQRGRAC